MPRVNNDTLSIDQPVGMKLKFSITQDVTDTLTEQERKSSLFDILQCQRQNKPDVFRALWEELGFEYTEGLPGLVESSRDLSAYLSDVAPDLSSIDLSKIVFRCASTLNLDITISEDKVIHWTLPQNHSSIQYIESGECAFPVRNKILNNKLGDVILVEEGEIVQATSPTGLIAQGEAILGIQTNNLHEYFLWFSEAEGSTALSGRWTVKFNEERGEWFLTRSYLFPAPLILSENLEQYLTESGVSCSCFSPESLRILEADALGKQWLSSVSVEHVRETYSKYKPKQANLVSVPIKEVMTPKDWAKAYSGEAPHWAIDMNPSKFVQEFALKLTDHKNPKVLEIGCGNGRDSIFMSQSGFDVTSIDITPKAIELAKSNAGKVEANCTFKVGNAEKLQFADKSFNGVFTLSVLHSTDLSKSLPEAYRILDVGGIAFIYIYGNTQSADGT